MEGEGVRTSGNKLGPPALGSPSGPGSVVRSGIRASPPLGMFVIKKAPSRAPSSFKEMNIYLDAFQMLGKKLEGNPL